MKILIAIDGSVHSHHAVEYLIDHVHWYRLTPFVDLVYVHLPLPSLPFVSLTADQVDRYYNSDGNAALAKAKNMLDTAGISYTAHVLVGPIAETIVQHGRQAACDLIMLGTRGMGAGGNLLLGSIATKVLYFSSIPVMVVNSAMAC